jgi:hypothetical protein
MSHNDTTTASDTWCLFIDVGMLTEEEFKAHKQLFMSAFAVLDYTYKEVENDFQVVILDDNAEMHRRLLLSVPLYLTMTSTEATELAKKVKESLQLLNYTSVVVFVHDEGDKIRHEFKIDRSMTADVQAAFMKEKTHNPTTVDLRPQQMIPSWRGQFRSGNVLECLHVRFQYNPYNFSGILDGYKPVVAQHQPMLQSELVQALSPLVPSVIKLFQNTWTSVIKNVLKTQVKEKDNTHEDNAEDADVEVTGNKHPNDDMTSSCPSKKAKI